MEVQDYVVRLSWVGMYHMHGRKIKVHKLNDVDGKGGEDFACSTYTAPTEQLLG